ncbi:MAG: glycosyl hydrolase family 28 protein, partial [Verrucomicrobiia bacterium]
MTARLVWIDTTRAQEAFSQGFMMKKSAGMRCPAARAVKLQAQTNQRPHRRSFAAPWWKTTAGAVMLLLAVGGSVYADPPLPVISNQVFVVTNTAFAGGAYGDGVSNNAAAINAAISFASANGGGTVEIPAVGTLTNYLSGPITMASHVNLQIDTNAVLRMEPMVVWTNLYGTTTFLDGATLTDVEISGSGTIDGQGSKWWSPTYGSRPNFVEFDHCTRVLIQNVWLQNPPKFHIYLKNSDTSVTIQGITINTPSSSPNTDGADIASTNVLIRNCYISDGDDNLEIGGSDLASDITVSNCTFGTGHGLSLGSDTPGGVNNLLVSNCTWNGTEYGIHMKSDRGIGGLAKNLTYEDLVMSNVDFAIAIYSYYNEIGAPPNSINVTPFMASTDVVHSASSTPVWQNITISNVTVTNLNGNIAGIIWGLPESLVSNVTITGLNIAAPTKTFCVYNATGINVVDSNFTPATGTNTWTIYRAGMTITNSAANTNLVTVGGLAAPPTNNVLGFFNGLASITASNELGAGSITLGGSTLSLSQSTVTFSNNIGAASASTLVLPNGTDTLQGALTGPGPLAVTLTNSGALRFNQGANAWGGSNAIFNAGSSGTINNHSAGNINIVLGALSGGSGSTLRGSDQNGPGVDTYVIGNLNSNTTFAGTIADGTGGSSPHTVALVEVGTGALTLSAANTYSGGTTVSNGTLSVENTAGSGTGAGAVTIVSGGTLGGTGVVAGPVTVNGTLSPTLSTGNSPGTLTVSNNLVVNSGAVLQYQLGANSDLTVVSGNLTLGDTLNVSNAGGFSNGTYTLFTYGGALTYNGVSIGTTPGTNFTYAVSTSTPGQVNLVVSCSAGAAGSISGSSSVNAGDSGDTYSISSVSGATSYTWTVPPGASIASGQGTTSITVNYSCSAVSGNVAVTPSNGSCSGTSSSQSVTVTPVGAAGSISGPTAVCAGQTSLGYSISSVSGATTYTWTVPSDAMIASGQGGTSILVTWGSTAGNVTVTPANANGCTGSGSGLSVAVNTAPSVLSGPSPQAVCDDGSATFTVSASGAGLSYQWQKNGSNISDSGTIGGSGTSTLTLTGVGTGDSGASFDCVVSGTCSPPATSGAATLTVSANPAVFNVTGGGPYCAASGSVTVGLDGSESTADYLLELNGTPTGAQVAGTGSAISFTGQTAVGTYTVIASNVTSGCTATMNGNASVTPVDPFTCWEEVYGITNCAVCDGNSSYTGDGMS